MIAAAVVSVWFLFHSHLQHRKNYFLEQIYSVEPNTILSLESAIYVLAQKRWSFQNRNS